MILSLGGLFLLIFIVFCFEICIIFLIFLSIKYHIRSLKSIMVLVIILFLYYLLVKRKVL